MKFIKKNAEFIGHTYFKEEVFDEWRCPNKNCGFSVSEDYICCPYCGQRLKFNRLERKEKDNLNQLILNILEEESNG